MKKLILALFTIMMLASTALADWETPDVYLSLDDADKNSTHYFDGTSNYDASIIITSGSLLTTTGNINEGVEFNASLDNTAIEVDDYNPDSSVALTFCLGLIPFNTNPAGGAYLIGQDTTSDGSSLWFYLSNDQIDFGICDDGCTNGIGYYVDATVLALNEKNHLCVVYEHNDGNSSDIKMYHNGTQMLPMTGIYDWGTYTGYNINFSEEPLTVGAYQSSGGSIFDIPDGIIDEVYLFDEAISPTGIQSLSDAMFAGEQYSEEEPEAPTINTGGGSGVTGFAVADPTPEPTTTTVEPTEEEPTFLDDMSGSQKVIVGAVLVGLSAGTVALYTSRTPKPKRRRKK